MWYTFFSLDMKYYILKIQMNRALVHYRDIIQFIGYFVILVLSSDDM